MRDDAEEDAEEDVREQQSRGGEGTEDSQRSRTQRSRCSVAGDKEDQYWREAEGSKSRAAKKREEEKEKRAEAAARKAEARRIAEQEEKELEKARRKPNKKANRVLIPVPKVTESELQRQREAEQAQILKIAEVLRWVMNMTAIVKVCVEVRRAAKARLPPAGEAELLDSKLALIPC
ncbi:unnamed protein product [Camellia sinensis]